MVDSQFYDISQSPSVDPWVVAPTPGYYGDLHVYSPSPSPHPLSQVQQPLGFLQSGEREEGAEHVCYTIAWKLHVNDKKAGSRTAKDLTVAPSQYWEEKLKAALEEMLQTKSKTDHRFRFEGADIVVSVNDRTQTNFEDFASSTNIDWLPVEAQLCKWGHLPRIGKTLTVNLVFKYRRERDVKRVTKSKKGEKRNRVSTTNIMLAECDEDITAEEERTGRPSTWNRVYGLMKCNTTSCQLNSDWCWENPKDGKYYKLRQPHLEQLCDYVDDENRLESHSDVPESLRRSLILESQRKSKKATMPTSEMPYQHPVNINLVPAQATHSMDASLPPTPSFSFPEIPGDRVTAVEKFFEWLESQYTNESYKADFRRARDVILETRMDLELILKDPKPDRFTNKGIPEGTALRVICEIPKWAEYLKRISPSRGISNDIDQ
ncbi:uncharacterized protein TRUGW13939_09702 [Talaromyces rugulosus]|uniref:Uncharacterized protein n=1 Tax=Talaromyces rugulosus TaxID=121627 RepID=A0A7H8R9X4_TALRU|nr:uncharacterized protein TRUGW13939_09702 [Talaromyces rugulosus]QKX62541.1 hypothetical protein TRUGW13939_09702 [Talaromyces rugulosus]